MPKFTYLAKTRDGITKQGIVTASNEDIALTALQSKDLIVISLQNNNNKSVFSKDLDIFNRVSTRELVVFTRILSVFLEVQISLVEGLLVLRDQNIKNKYFYSILDKIILDIQDGSLLSDAIQKYPKVFDNFFVYIVRSGETSGGLQKSLLYMADYLEEQYSLNNKIRGALTYPLFIMFVFIILGLGIAYYILPQLVDVLNNLGEVNLPFTTKLIIWFSDFLQNYILIILLAIFAIIGGFVYFIKTKSGIYWSDKWKLKLPVFGQLFTKLYIVRFSNNMKNLLSAGVPLISSLETSSEVVGNSIFKDIIKESILNVKSGGQLSETLLKHKEFPYIASQIIAVGEKTAKTTTALETLARFYKQEVDTVVDNLTTLIEPVMIVILGIGVAIFVVSILMPIYNIAGSF